MSPLSIDKSYALHWNYNVACMVTLWLFFFGFAMICSAILRKIWRVKQLLNNVSGFKRIMVLAFGVIWLFVSISVLNICPPPFIWTSVERPWFGNAWSVIRPTRRKSAMVAL